MNLPNEELIKKVVDEINSLSSQTKFSLEVKEGYCSLLPDNNLDFSNSILNVLRKRKTFKCIFIWINETFNNYTIDFTLKY